MRILLILAAAVLVISSCSSQKSIWQDEEIDSRIATEVQAVNMEVIRTFKYKNLMGLKELCHDSLWDNAKGSLRHLMWGSFTEFNDSVFSVFNQYLLNVDEAAIGTVQSFQSAEPETASPHDYTLHFKAMESEVYAIAGRFLHPEREFALVTFYGKQEGSWKLYNIQFGPITVGGKDAWGWHEASQGRFEEGHILDATFDADKALQCMRPGNAQWEYSRQQEIIDWQKEVLAKANEAYPMPMSVDYVESEPSILQIYPQRVDAGLTPVVVVLTTLDDPSAVAEECVRIHEGIQGLFPGIDQNRDFITYAVYQDQPSQYGDEPYETYYLFFK